MAKDPSLRKQNDLAREVDRLLRQLPFADPMLRGDVATAPRSAPARVGTATMITRRAPATSATLVARRAPAEPSALAQTISAWLRALLAAVLGVAVSIWPYPSDCGWMVSLALLVIATVMVAGAWASIWAWRLHTAAAHVVSLAVVFWGVVLAAEQVLPRIGYAAVSAAWTCVAPMTAEAAPSRLKRVGAFIEEGRMSKKHRTQVPQFGTTRSPLRDAKGFSSSAPPATGKHSPTPVQRPKPPATSAKSGRRGT